MAGVVTINGEFDDIEKDRHQTLVSTFGDDVTNDIESSGGDVELPNDVQSFLDELDGTLEDF